MRSARWLNARIFCTRGVPDFGLKQKDTVHLYDTPANLSGDPRRNGCQPASARVPLASPVRNMNPPSAEKRLVCGVRVLGLRLNVQVGRSHRIRLPFTVVRSVHVHLSKS